MRPLRFVPARPEHAQALRLLAHDSEAHWGFSEEFMEQFDRTFNITAGFIAENPVYAAFEGESPLAFWGLRQDGEGWELEYFYVAQESLGAGYGRQMWLHLTQWCARQGIAGFHFVTSPQAIGFYEKMGAGQDGVTRSALDGRPIPHFVCRL